MLSWDKFQQFETIEISIKKKKKKLKQYPLLWVASFQYQEVHIAKFPWEASLQYFQKTVDALKAFPPTHESYLCLRNQHKININQWKMEDDGCVTPKYLTQLIYPP